MSKQQPKKETANRITSNIIRLVNMQPNCDAARVNSTGIWDTQKKIFRKSHSTKGIADIVCCIRGIHAEFEVKAGLDKPSEHQLIRQQNVRLAGGIYEFVYSTDEFILLFSKIIENGKLPKK